MDIAKFIDGLKLSSRHVAPVAITSGVLVFGPLTLLSRLGVLGFVGSYRAWLGVVFLLSSAILTVHGAIAVAAAYRNWRGRGVTSRARRASLDDLTPAEKALLSLFINGNTRTLTLSIMSGVVAALEARDAIYRATNVGRLTSFAYNIQPWAREYLTKNPRLLEGADESGRQDIGLGRGGP